jgi:hypothetical protein
MTLAEARKLRIGVYIVHWKSGGASYAAIGQNHDGTPWCTPCNWLGTQHRSTIWRSIESVEPVKIGLVQNNGWDA